MANDLTNKKPTMSAILASNGIKELANSLSLTPKQINKAKGAALALSSNPNLSKCDPFSLVKYCYEIARYDFSRDDCVYPVPYYDSHTGSTKVQAQIGFRGFRELAYQSGLYSEINASVVYSDDKVRRDRETGEIVVEFSESPEAMDGAVVGYFAFAKDKQGKLISSVYMSKAKMDKHRDTYSNSKSGPWTTSYEKMALKTVIKQLCGQISTSPLLNDAIKLDQSVIGGKDETDKYLDNPITYPENDQKEETERPSVVAPQLDIDIPDIGEDKQDGGAE